MKNRPWLPAEDALLRLHYPTMRSTALALLLGRSLTGMYKRAEKLGLSKPQVFAPDYRPHNYAPIGATTTSGRHGYLMVKVAEGSWPEAWRPAHHLAWEAAYGPLPSEHVLAFKDGNAENRALANLELVAKRDWLMRYHPETTLPPALAALIRTKAALTRAINDAARAQDDG